ncbi:hypothetical protein LTR84_012334 [Exophiala bonariae]|uniref:ubiquitinyl hydrolase 1 n=1 Tax=Exophiala bonariae TaxID=1690606 RepID=A0AAV9NFX2_9EURO|nr:hypothetical protein LTR84_012334 [Exophiala bonariae]
MVWERSKGAFEYSLSRYTPPITTRKQLSPTNLPDPDDMGKSDDQLTSLALVELWIEENLDTWVSMRLSRPYASRMLHRFLLAYHQAAKKVYQGHPERMSHMFLAIFELWVAIDRISTNLHPLLLDHSPEVPLGVLESLLLDKRAALERLARVELHIATCRQSNHTQPQSMFSDPSEQSFGVRFYNQSEPMQYLRAKIEADAQQVRDSKSLEWQEKKTHFEDLMKRVNRMDCGTWTPRDTDRNGNPYVGQTRHDKKCRKCKLRKEANAIEIAKHEWPLPEDEVQCKAAVFELQAPEAILTWRDATWFVVHTLGRADFEGPTSQQSLLSYPPLVKYVQNNDRRITLASRVKPMIKTHFLKSGLFIDRIFVNNGLILAFKDTARGRERVWTAQQDHSAISLSRDCQSRLLSTEPKHLVRQVNATSHTHNSVLAMQSKCPPEMSPHEHVLFGSLRSGERLQLINILAMVMSSEADINSVSTAVLATHAIWHVGKRDLQRLSGYLRESQLDLLNESFCDALLSAVDARFSSIEANWKEATQPQQGYFYLVLRIRHAALNWIRRLAKLYSNRRTASAGSENLKELSRQITSSGLLARRTFHLDAYRQQLEFSKIGTVADYVEASIHLHDHQDQATKDDDPKRQGELLNDAYHSRNSEAYLLLALQASGQGISDGIKRFWLGASFTDAWQIVDDHNKSWIKNWSKSKIVHYNLVTGSLLVSGRSLSRLPPGYTDDLLYRSIFADLDLEVFASDVDDMEYMSRVEYEGHQIYFGKRDNNLLIRSRRGDETFEAISRDIFDEDLPQPVFRNTSPWMSLETGNVFFRRHNSPWISHDDDWMLSLDIESRRSISLYSNIGYLVDSSSVVGQNICHIFEPFEDPQHIVIFKSNDAITTVQITLPRYHLNFLLQLNGDIKCKELSAIVDRSQSIGTFHGLKNKLVLRAANTISARTVRTVLIPNGNVTVSAVPPHVEVRIQLNKDGKLTFSQYRLDGRLGQLVSDDLEGHLLKTYLHAITSFPEPDSFTSRTGTEEALFGLSDPVTRTTVPLSARAQKLLGLLAGLSSELSFYPKGLRMMHTITLKENLPVLAQRDIFFGTVLSIISHNSNASFLFEEKTSAINRPIYPGDTYLLERSHWRSSKLFANESVVDDISLPEDLHYKSRDLVLSPAQEQAFAMASLVTSGKSNFIVDPEIKSLLKGWETISGFHQEFSILSIAQLLDEPLKDHWAPLLSWCRKSPSKSSLCFLFSLMTYGDSDRSPQLQTLLAFAGSARLQGLPVPYNDFYDFRDGYSVNQRDIKTILSECERPYTSASEDEEETDSEEDSEAESEGQIRYDEETAAQSRQFMEAVEASWPGSHVELPRKRNLSHYNYGDLKALLNGRFAAWYQNYEFLSLCDKYEQSLRSRKHSWTAPEIPPIIIYHTSAQRDRIPCPTRPSILAIMKTVDVTEADFCETRPSMLDHNLANVITARQKIELLNANETRVALEGVEEIIEELEADATPTVREYGRFINKSLQALNAAAAATDHIRHPTQIFLREKATVVQTRIDYILRQCRVLLGPQLPSERALGGARLWPSVSDMALLQLLSAENRSQLPIPWKKVILRFAEEITALQRVERMQKYLAADDKFALSKELANPAHAGWSTEDWPDWLLLEIQNQILIRPEQIHIALEIIEPKSGVVLADMGIGKSSTILPMVVTALATGSSLVRVIVLKPLANEMLRILSRSLAGLVGRAVYYLPISRQTNLTGKNLEKLQGIYETCIENAGVLVSLPEHLNSFRLLCNDKLHADADLAQQLFGIQDFVDRNARDVIDESDQVLEPGYELVYTTGESSLLSKSPERWVVALEMLELVRRNVGTSLANTPSGLEVERRATGSFDHIRVLNEEGAQTLMTSLVDSILEGGLPSVPLGHCNAEVLQALRSFIHDADLEPEAFQLVSDHFEGSEQLDILYVVRGLISYQILTHALRKRWMVNYGLDRTRAGGPGGCLAAVPYRAKAIPSQSSEFAQPETMIILTTLSYYYTGLLYQELRQCILMLLRLPDPSEEFSKWVMNSRLPATYRKAIPINLDDALCLDTLYQHFRLNKAAIDFFLKLKVFPKEAREFKWKLSTSAWDLCATDNGRVTTGFSGTCDSRIPSTIKQKDLQSLRHSTASTLATILRYDNRQYICAASSHGQRLSTDEMIDLIVGQVKERSVIIDVGAQFLEDNKEIAAKWLNKCNKNKLAAIFFNDRDEKMVLNHDGSTEKFNSSIFKDEIGSCVIYLDEFHTRGTDFQLPDSFAAAVLLGPRIPKDNLVQACMRMRKLAATQSVVFIAPPEVDQSIRAVKETTLEDLSSLHVIRWAIHQSCLVLQHQDALCTTKGIVHSRHRLAVARHVQHTGLVVNVKTYLQQIREQESRPVFEMYRPDQSHGKELPFLPSEKEREDEIMANLLIDWHRIDTAGFEDNDFSEEQEREVLHEVEQEREVERPREVVPAVPAECKALLNLIRDGTIPSGSLDGIVPAFDLLKTTKLAAKYSQASWPMQILATTDFIHTIASRGESAQDDFLRPVTWVLHAKRIKQPIIISPHEANLFMESIRESKRASLFLYQARVSKSMVSFDKLNVYKIPEHEHGVTITPEQSAILNLFAGQLYFNNFEEYKVLCMLIGLWDGERELPNRRNVASDNWVSPACRKANGWTECTFKSSPIQTIKAFINMRRLGIEWSHTHMGRILAGRLLNPKDFEDEDNVPAEGLDNLVSEENHFKNDQVPVAALQSLKLTEEE